MSIIKPREHILDIPLYIPGGDIPGVDNPVRLASNESPLGPSPAAVKAFHATADVLARYPDSACADLRRALAEQHQLDFAQITCANGSEQLIDLLARGYSGPTDEVIFTEHAFIAYRIATQASGATPVAVSEKHYTADVDLILSKISARTRIVFLANPNNPTGTFLKKEEIYRLRESLPVNILLVIDAAYSEYVTHSDYSACHPLASESDGNTVVLHTFSKIYGLAALRVGWMVSNPDIAGVLERIKGVFSVSRPAQAAAIAALLDEEHTRRAQAHNHKWLQWLRIELERIGLETSPSLGNFLLIHFSSPEQSQGADHYLRRQGIIVRPVAGYGLPQCLRVSVGLEHENRKLTALLAEFLTRRG